MKIKFDQQINKYQNTVDLLEKTNKKNSEI
jgi:hypothetical protein